MVIAEEPHHSRVIRRPDITAYLHSHSSAYVKPYVKMNKNDSIDAEACAEAVTRPTMRFVPIKTDDQLDLQSLRRVRER